MNTNRVVRAIRRIYCSHQSVVWLRELADKPQGGVYPVKCCLDCGKLTWANMTPPGTYTYLKPEKIGQYS